VSASPGTIPGDAPDLRCRGGGLGTATATPSVDDLWNTTVALNVTGIALVIVQTVGTAAAVDSVHDEERGVAIAFRGFPSGGPRGPPIPAGVPGMG
jgi:hypothetical protein